MLALIIAPAWLFALLLALAMCRAARAGEVQLALAGEPAQRPAPQDPTAGATRLHCADRAR